MKRLSVLCLLAINFLTIADSDAQRRTGQNLMQRKDERGGEGRAAGCPRAYIGFSTGINNPVGILGPQVDIAITPHVSVGTGVGLSSWGVKTFLEARYYFRPCNRGWAIGSGFTHNTGGTEITYQSQNTIVGTADVTINAEPQTNFMVSGYHFFSLGRRARNRFHLQFGFSVPLGTRGVYTQVGGPPYNSTGRNEARLLSPGGVILGLGFSFGAGRM